MVDTNNQLQELSNLARTLNTETDTYIEALTQLENKLKRMNLGVEAWVFLDETNESGNLKHGSSVRTYLGFAKTSPDGWGFAVKKLRIEREVHNGEEYEEAFQHEEAKLLLKSSRELRILAAQCIEALLRELRKRADEAIGALQRAQKISAQV